MAEPGEDTCFALHELGYNHQEWILGQEEDGEHTLPGIARTHADITNMSSLDDIMKGMHLVGVNHPETGKHVSGTHCLLDRCIFVKTVTS